MFYCFLYKLSAPSFSSCLPCLLRKVWWCQEGMWERSYDVFSSGHVLTFWSTGMHFHRIPACYHTFKISAHTHALFIFSHCSLIPREGLSLQSFRFLLPAPFPVSAFPHPHHHPLPTGDLLSDSLSNLPPPTPTPHPTYLLPVIYYAFSPLHLFHSFSFSVTDCVCVLPFSGVRLHLFSQWPAHMHFAFSLLPHSHPSHYHPHHMPFTPLPPCSVH